VYETLHWLGLLSTLIQVTAARSVLRAWRVNCLIVSTNTCVYRCVSVSFHYDKRSEWCSAFAYVFCPVISIATL